MEPLAGRRKIFVAVTPVFDEGDIGVSNGGGGAISIHYAPSLS